MEKKKAILGHMLFFLTLFQANMAAASNCQSFYVNAKEKIFLSNEIDVNKMNDPGYQIVDTKPILHPDLVKQLIDLIPTVGTRSIDAVGSAHEIRFPREDNNTFPALEALPPALGAPIIEFIRELERELNQKFSETEGKIRFSFGIVRNFSRSSLVDSYHSHQNGHFSATISLYGPGSVVPINQHDPELRKIYPKILDLLKPGPNQLVLMTDGQRARKLNIPSTEHGSPTQNIGEQRLVLLLHFDLVPN